MRREYKSQRSSRVKYLLTMTLLLTLVSAVIFQNCSTYQADVSPLSNGVIDDGSSALNCLGDKCDPDVEESTISINNQPPVRVANTDIAFDLGGNCNTAGYEDSRFYYSIRQDGTNTQVIGRTPTQVKCDSVGRWSMSIQLPAGWNYAQVYVVTVVMTIIDDTGVEVDNPRKTNSKEIRTSNL